MHLGPVQEALVPQAPLHLDREPGGQLLGRGENGEVPLVQLLQHDALERSLRRGHPPCDCFLRSSLAGRHGASHREGLVVVLLVLLLVVAPQPPRPSVLLLIVCIVIGIVVVAIVILVVVVVVAVAVAVVGTLGTLGLNDSASSSPATPGA